MVKVPKDFQDFDDDDEKIERRLSRNNYWSNLRKLRTEFSQENKSTDHYAFIEWLQEKYGFKPILTEDLQYTDDFVVTDEKKYVVYILKYE